MTLRELPEELQAVDEKSLDTSVLLSPPAGGYEEISRISIMYVEHVVLHLVGPFENSSS
jgi:hypothetical protein